MAIAQPCYCARRLHLLLLDWPGRRPQTPVIAPDVCTRCYWIGLDEDHKYLVTATTMSLFETILPRINTPRVKKRKGLSAINSSHHRLQDFSFEKAS